MESICTPKKVMMEAGPTTLSQFTSIPGLNQVKKAIEPCLARRFIIRHHQKIIDVTETDETLFINQYV
jgi:hypothetical protein